MIQPLYHHGHYDGIVCMLPESVKQRVAERILPRPTPAYSVENKLKMLHSLHIAFDTEAQNKAYNCQPHTKIDFAEKH